MSWQNCWLNNHAWQRSIKTELPIEKGYEKTEFENILFFNLSGMRNLETTMTKFKEFQATSAKRFTQTSPTRPEKNLLVMKFKPEIQPHKNKMI